MNYRVVETTNAIGEGNERMAMARIVSSGKVSLDDLAKYINDTSSFTAADVKGVLTAIADAAARYLSMGLSVDLDPLGTLNVTLRSETTPTKEEFTYRNIIGAKVNFRPTAQLTDEVNKDLHFNNIEAIQ